MWVLLTSRNDCLGALNNCRRELRAACARRAQEAAGQAQAAKQAADAQVDALQGELVAARADQQRLAEVEGACSGSPARLSSLPVHLHAGDPHSMHCPCARHCGSVDATACACAKPLHGDRSRRACIAMCKGRVPVACKILQIKVLLRAVLAEEALTSLEGKSREAAALQGQLEESSRDVDRLRAELGALEQQAAGLTGKVRTLPLLISW